jgi:hypothetical protein
MALTLISTHTASADASIDITSGITSTYDSYEFHCVNMHPATNDEGFAFQVNASDDTGGGFDTSLITSTFFRAKHHESGATGLDYTADYDQAQAAGYQRLCNDVGNEDNESVSGVLTLYAPSSVTYVKHFTSRMNENHALDISMDNFVAGYINTQLAIPEISFKFTSGAIQAGTIKMFGVS